jgi:TetR/AcrR family transcriptional regulator, transcriptional repressor for nem operon
MARPRKFDPDDVLDEAMRQFWQHGYGDTSVDSLVEATGVQPGSLYNTFKGGKHALFMGSLERYSKLVVPEKMGALEARDAGLPEIRAYFDGLVQDLLSEEGRMGCLMVNSAIELAAVDPRVAEVVSGHMDRLERNVARALRNAVKRGEVPASVDPDAKAKLLMATGMGLMVVGKTDPGKEVLETIVNSAFADLG